MCQSHFRENILIYFYFSCRMWNLYCCSVMFPENSFVMDHRVWIQKLFSDMSFTQFTRPHQRRLDKCHQNQEQDTRRLPKTDKINLQSADHSLVCDLKLKAKEKMTFGSRFRRHRNVFMDGCLLATSWFHALKGCRDSLSKPEVFFNQFKF